MPPGDYLTQESQLYFGLCSRRSSHLSKLLNNEEEFGHLFLIGGVKYSLCGRHVCLIQTLERTGECWAESERRRLSQSRWSCAHDYKSRIASFDGASSNWRYNETRLAIMGRGRRGGGGRRVPLGRILIRLRDTHIAAGINTKTMKTLRDDLSGMNQSFRCVHQPWRWSRGYARDYPCSLWRSALS